MAPGSWKDFTTERTPPSAAVSMLNFSSLACRHAAAAATVWRIDPRGCLLRGECCTTRYVLMVTFRAGLLDRSIHLKPSLVESLFVFTTTSRVLLCTTLLVYKVISRCLLDFPNHSSSSTSTLILFDMGAKPPMCCSAKGRALRTLSATVIL